MSEEHDRARAAVEARHVHTADLSEEDLRGLRAFLHDAYEGAFGDADWEHTLGGLHVLVHEEDSSSVTPPSSSAASFTATWRSGQVTSRASPSVPSAGAGGTQAWRWPPPSA